jgi:hypothetical protein
MRRAESSLRVVALTILGTLLTATAGVWLAREGKAATIAPAAEPASRNPCLKFLPKDYWLAGNCDVKAVMEFVGREQANAPQQQMLKQYMQMIRQFSGIDPEREVQYVTFFAAGSLEQDPQMLAVVKGSFDNDTVAGRLAALVGKDMTPQQHNGKRIYVSDRMGYGFPEESTLLVGSGKLLREAMDVGAAGASLPPALKNVLDHTSANSVVWVALRPQVILAHKALAEWRGEHQVLSRSLDQIEALSLYFEGASDGGLVSALGYLPSTATAERVFEALSGLKHSLLHTEGSNVFYSSFLILSDLETRGSYVKGSLRLTAQALEELWKTRLIIKPGQGK